MLRVFNTGSDTNEKKIHSNLATHAVGVRNLANLNDRKPPSVSDTMNNIIFNCFTQHARSYHHSQSFG